MPTPDPRSTSNDDQASPTTRPHSASARRQRASATDAPGTEEEGDFTLSVDKPM